MRKIIIRSVVQVAALFFVMIIILSAYRPEINMVMETPPPSTTTTTQHPLLKALPNTDMGTSSSRGAWQDGQVGINP